MITTRSISPSRAGRGRRARGSRVRRAPTARPEARSWRRVRAGSLMGRRIARGAGAQPGGRQPARQHLLRVTRATSGEPSSPDPRGERKSVEEGAARRARTPGEARVDGGLAVFEGRPGRGGARRDALQPARGRRTCAHARLRGADDVVQAHPPLARAPGRARTRRCPAAVEAVVERRDTRLLRAPERAPAALDCAAAVLPGLTARLHGDPTAAERGHAASWHVLLA